MAERSPQPRVRFRGDPGLDGNYRRLWFPQALEALVGPVRDERAAVPKTHRTPRPAIGGSFRSLRGTARNGRGDVLSRRRVVRRVAEAEHGPLSGRQWTNLRKALQREARHG